MPKRKGPLSPELARQIAQKATPPLNYSALRGAMNAGALRELHTTALRLLLYLLAHANDKGLVWLSMASMAEAVSPGNVNRVRRAISELERKGWLATLVPGGGRYGSTMRQIRAPGVTLDPGQPDPGIEPERGPTGPGSDPTGTTATRVIGDPLDELVPDQIGGLKGSPNAPKGVNGCPPKVPDRRLEGQTRARKPVEVLRDHLRAVAQLDRSDRHEFREAANRIRGTFPDRGPVPAYLVAEGNNLVLRAIDAAKQSNNHDLLEALGMGGADGSDRRGEVLKVGGSRASQPTTEILTALRMAVSRAPHEGLRSTAEALLRDGDREAGWLAEVLSLLEKVNVALAAERHAGRDPGEDLTW